MCTLVYGIGFSTPMRAQCVADAGFSPTVTTPSGTVSMSTSYGTGWTSELVHIQNTFEVNNNFTILTCSVLVDAGVEIVVKDDYTLTIETSVISNCENSMWEQIRVEPGGAVRVRVNSLVEHAETALLIENATGNPGNFEVRGSRLMNNYIGIDVRPFGGNHPGTIENSEIGAPSLIAPYLGRFGFAGLRADGITDGITVGRTSSSYGSGGSYNFIHDQEYGLLFTRSIAYVQNNWIKDIRTWNAVPGFGTGAGIAAVGNAFNQNLYVGYPDAGVTGFNNRIEDCEKGVFTLKMTSSITDNNLIIGSGGADPTMNHGVWYHETGNSQVINNTISNFDSIGIYIRNAEGSCGIDNNTLDNPNVVSNSSCRIAGIELRASLGGYSSVTNNELSRLQFGISVISALAEISENTISVRLPGTCSGEFSIGIHAEYSPGLVVLDNTISSGCTSCMNTNIRGIDITEAQNFLVDRNEMNDFGVGAAAHGDCQGGNFTCNTMNECRYGFGLVGMDGGGLDIGPITENLSTLTAAGNSWFPASTANRTIAVTNAFGDPTLGTPLFPATFPPIFDWRYTTIYGAFMDMAPIATFNLEIGSGTRRVDPLLAGSSSLVCDLTPRLAGRGVAPSQKARNNLFSAFHYLLDSNDGSDCDFYEEKSYVYNFFAYNPDWLTLDVPQDVLYVAAMNELALGNYDEWYLFFNYLKSGSVDSAQLKLNSIVPNCLKDQLRQDVYTLYLNRSADSLAMEAVLGGRLPYTSSETATLHTIAGLDPTDGGDAVYFARAILGQHSLAPIDASLSPRQGNLGTVGTKPILLYPNPTSGFLVVEIDGSTAIQKGAEYVLSGIDGVVRLRSTVAEDDSIKLDITDFPKGIYLLTVSCIRGYTYSALVSKL
ncbi:MAG: T9SS type A sorting domain-containing protein [Bacteroidetes bacterium]|nr:T9SS type A sorting domain-containing protein [Bacteroidota bacterium]